MPHSRSMALTRGPALFRSARRTQLRQGGHDLIEGGEIPREALDVPKTDLSGGIEDKHPTELERVSAHRRLLEAGLLGTAGRQEQLRMQHVEHAAAQGEGPIRFSLGVDEEREGHPHLFGKGCRKGQGPIPDGVQLRTQAANFFVAVFEASDLLATEQSTKMPEEDQHRRSAGVQIRHGHTAAVEVLYRYILRSVVVVLLLHIFPSVEFPVDQCHFIALRFLATNFACEASTC